MKILVISLICPYEPLETPSYNAPGTLRNPKNASVTPLKSAENPLNFSNMPSKIPVSPLRLPVTHLRNPQKQPCNAPQNPMITSKSYWYAFVNAPDTLKIHNIRLRKASETHG